MINVLFMMGLEGMLRFCQSGDPSVALEVLVVLGVYIHDWRIVSGRTCLTASRVRRINLTLRLGACLHSFVSFSSDPELFVLYQGKLHLAAIMSIGLEDLDWRLTALHCLVDGLLHSTSSHTYLQEAVAYGLVTLACALCEHQTRSRISAVMTSDSTASMLKSVRRVLKGVADADVLLDAEYRILGESLVTQGGQGGRPSLTHPSSGMITCREDLGGRSFRGLLQSGHDDRKFLDFIASSSQQEDSQVPPCVRLRLTRATDWPNLLKILQGYVDHLRSGEEGQLSMGPLFLKLPGNRSSVAGRGFRQRGMNIVRAEGIFGLWRGNLAVILQVMPYAGLQFMTFDQYQQLLEPACSSPCLVRFVSGAAAGATATLFTYPLERPRAGWRGGRPKSPAGTSSVWMSKLFKRLLKPQKSNPETPPEPHGAEKTAEQMAEQARLKVAAEFDAKRKLMQEKLRQEMEDRKKAVLEEARKKKEDAAARQKAEEDRKKTEDEAAAEQRAEELRKKAEDEAVAARKKEEQAAKQAQLEEELRQQESERLEKEYEAERAALLADLQVDEMEVDEESVEEYCFFDFADWTPGALPHWIFNHDVSEACPWRHCDFNLVHQVAGSDELREHCCVFKLAQGYDDIVAAAVYRGAFLKRTELELLCKAKKVPWPKTGSGKNGGVVKLDLAWAVVEFLHGQETKAEKQRMVDGIMNSAGSVVPCPDELLDAIDQLDPVSREDFKDVKEICREQKERQKRVVTPTLENPQEEVKPSLLRVPPQIHLWKVRTFRCR
eukprot:g10702.t1